MIVPFPRHEPKFEFSDRIESSEAIQARPMFHLASDRLDGLWSKQAM